MFFSVRDAPRLGVKCRSMNNEFCPWWMIATIFGSYLWLTLLQIEKIWRFVDHLTSERKERRRWSTFRQLFNEELLNFDQIRSICQLTKSSIVSTQLELNDSRFSMKLPVNWSGKSRTKSKPNEEKFLTNWKLFDTVRTVFNFKGKSNIVWLKEKESKINVKSTTTKNFLFDRTCPSFCSTLQWFSCLSSWFDCSKMKRNSDHWTSSSNAQRERTRNRIESAQVCRFQWWIIKRYWSLFDFEYFSSNIARSYRSVLFV